MQRRFLFYRQYAKNIGAIIMSEKINKVLLAYSGGLDTSAIIPWLIDP